MHISNADIQRSNTSKQEKRSRSGLKNGIFIVILLILVVIITELLCGVLYSYITPQTGRTAVDILSGRLDPARKMAIQRHPYMLYVNTPYWEADGYQQINSMGYRGHEISLLPENGVTRILAVGGSTTFGQGVKDPAQAWPAQLEAILNHESGQNVEVVNGGLNYATSAELLLHYLFRDRDLQAKIVIIHTGGNDGGPLTLGNYTPDYTHWRTGWASSILQPRRGEPRLLKSNIASVFYAWWLKDRGSMGAYLDTRTMDQHATPEETTRYVEMNEPVGFRRNVELLVRNILQDGGQPVLFAYFTPSKAVYRNAGMNTRFEAYHEVIELAHSKNRRVLRELAKKHALLLIEIPQEVLPLDTFVDHAHINARGHQLKAQYVAKMLEPLLTKISP